MVVIDKKLLRSFITTKKNRFKKSMQQKMFAFETLPSLLILISFGKSQYSHLGEILFLLFGFFQSHSKLKV